MAAQGEGKAWLFADTATTMVTKCFDFAAARQSVCVSRAFWEFIINFFGGAGACLADGRNVFVGSGVSGIIANKYIFAFPCLDQLFITADRTIGVSGAAFACFGGVDAVAHSVLTGRGGLGS